MSEQNLLFSLEEENTENQGPVYCLGRTFANDKERKAFFREELRKKLSELRSIEGFPIGNDDDIINLSDPPYYTVCPNPWINDFIEQWEAEKTGLQKKGLRKAEFEVTEPYSSDVSEGKNNPIYSAHAYHTKVPHPAIMRYILHYTQPGDIVFDGFCGSGMTGVAANKCGNDNEVASLGEKNAMVGVRHAICSDLAPIATQIAAGYNLKFSFNEFKNRAESILNQVDNELGWMFETEIRGHRAKVNCTIWSDVFICPNCGKEIAWWDGAVDVEKQDIRDNFLCPFCGTDCSKKNMEKAWDTYYDTLLGKTVTVIKKVPVRVEYTLSSRRGASGVGEYDMKLLSKIDALDISNLYATPLPKGEKTSPVMRTNGTISSHMLYSKRSFIYLSRVLELAWDNVLLRDWFTSVCQSTSLMNKFRFTGTGITSGTIFLPSLCREYNPGNTLRSKLRDFSETDYAERGNSVISLLSSTSLATIKDSSIDYVFVDPPFGANIMYSELSTIWESWLRVKTNTKTEAIINKFQDKALFDYQSLMNRSFKEFYRILKAGKWLTIEFSNTSSSVWNSIQNSLQGVGFVVANVSALDKKQGSFNAVNSATAVKQDLVITCFKPTDKLVEKLETSLDTALNVWDFTEELLMHLPVHIQRESSTTAVIERSPKILYDRLIAYYVQHNYPVPMNASEFQAGLREHFVERDGMFFTVDQVIEYEDKKSQTPDFQPLSLFIGSEADGIQWLKTHLSEGEKTYAEILPHWMQDMVATKKGDEVPELMKILEENFIKNENGAWRNPDPEKEADLEIARTKKLLSQFTAYVEMASRPQGRIREARLEALRAGFKDCYKKRDFATIMMVGNKIPESLLTEDDVLLQYYDIASMHV